VSIELLVSKPVLLCYNNIVGNYYLKQSIINFHFYNLDRPNAYVF